MERHFRSDLFLGLGTAAQAPRESSWVPLFNGKDLTGWKKNGDEKWVVEEGTILCESTANKYGYLTTEKTYKDFTLRLKFKRSEEHTSELQSLTNLVCRLLLEKKKKK